MMIKSLPLRKFAPISLVRQRPVLLAAFVLVLFISLRASGAESHLLQKDEHVILFPGYAHPVNGGAAWELVIHGRVCKGWNPPPLLGSFVKKIALLLAENRRPSSFKLRLLSNPVTTVAGHPAPSLNTPQSPDIAVTPVDFKKEDSGHFTVKRIVSEKTLLPWLQESECGYKKLLIGVKDSRDPESRNYIYLYHDQGIAVVSDVDDTIKDTHVWSAEAMVVRTALPFKRVTGMPELYQYWCKNYHARFYYVSGTFDQLCGPIQSFLERSGFPPGSLDTKVVNIRDLPGTPEIPGSRPHSPAEIRADDPCKYKIKRIEPILRDFPNTKFCLVGDAGEGDDKAYLKLASDHPDQVRWICIRRLVPHEHFREALITPREKDARSVQFSSSTRFILFNGKTGDPTFTNAPLSADKLKELTAHETGSPDTLNDIFRR